MPVRYYQILDLWLQHLWKSRSGGTPNPSRRDPEHRRHHSRRTKGWTILFVTHCTSLLNDFVLTQPLLGDVGSSSQIHFISNFRLFLLHTKLKKHDIFLYLGYFTLILKNKKNTLFLYCKVSPIFLPNFGPIWENFFLGYFHCLRCLYV